MEVDVVTQKIVGITEHADSQFNPKRRCAQGHATHCVMASAGVDHETKSILLLSGTSLPRIAKRATLSRPRCRLDGAASVTTYVTCGLTVPINLRRDTRRDILPGI